MTGPTTLLVGAGVFGLSAAIELRRRGHRVVVFEPGTAPRPEASSTDVSKAVRMDYGEDDFFTALAAEALIGWRAWNRTWDRPLFHEVGFGLFASKPLAPGDFEFESLIRMQRRNAAVHRFEPSSTLARFPAWRDAGIVDGYVNADAGYVESGEVVARLVVTARAAGVDVRERTAVVRVTVIGGRPTVTIAGGEQIACDTVVVAAGAWTPRLLPQLAGRLTVSGQPVFQLRPANPDAFRAERFPVWGFDLPRAGWYGFPLLRDGTVKIANHGAGSPIEPDAPGAPSAAQHQELREFLARRLPALADAELVASRLCPYCEAWDGTFYIDHDPDAAGIVVAAGGSGHGFKFGPVLGPIIADVVERRPDPHGGRFRWRPIGAPRYEPSRDPR